MVEIGNAKDRDRKRIRVQSKSFDTDGEIIREWTLKPGEGLGFTVNKNQIIRVIDLEGQQVLDFVCFNHDDKSEKLWIGATINANRSIYLRKGGSLYSNHHNKMFTLVEDTCGVHDLICGACSKEVYEKVYGMKDHPNCTQNFVNALSPYGLERKDIPMNLNIFMNCPVGEDGSYAIDYPKSRRGDFVDLKADMDCIVAVSNCPSDNGPCNGYFPTPTKVMVYEEKESM
jgi:urea carboxylase-associated protein 1